MNYYETLYIIHPALEAGRLKDIIIGVEENLKKVKGTPISLELWGKRKLSYFIDKQKYGTYVLIQYSGQGTCTRDLAIELEHNPNILAYLTTNISKQDIKEINDDLDTQIAGKSREGEKNNTDAPNTLVNNDDLHENSQSAEENLKRKEETIESNAEVFNKKEETNQENMDQASTISEEE